MCVVARIHPLREKELRIERLYRGLRGGYRGQETGQREDVIDANIYGNHPIYLDTRYYEVSDSGEVASHKSPVMRILEVGASISGITRHPERATGSRGPHWGA
jgi:hypothetical protein